MAGVLLQRGVVLLVVVIAVIVALVALVALAWSARAAARRRRERAMADAATTVVETPPAPGPLAERQPEPEPEPAGPDPEPAAPGPDAVPEQKAPPKPETGMDSALAGLDGGLFVSSLPQGANRNGLVMPAPREAVDDERVTAPTRGSAPANSPDPANNTAPPYPGAAHPLPDGSAPSGDYRVKAVLGAKRYYTQESPYFARTTAQVWFRSAEDAQRAGFTAAV